MMMMSANLPPRFTASTQPNPKGYNKLQGWAFETDDFPPSSSTGKKLFLLNANTLKRNKWDNLFSGKFIAFSIILHATVAVVALILFFLAQFLGWDLSFFDIKTETPKDVEFVIVNNTKPEKPLDPNTKNRSTVSSRSGGEKSPQRQGEEHQVAGASGATPSPVSPPESSSSPAHQAATQPKASQAPSEKLSPTVKTRKKLGVTSPTPPITVYSETAPAPSAPKPKWKPAQTKPANEPTADDDFEPPAPILTKPSKIASSSTSSSSSSGKKAIRLGPDQIGSPSSKPIPAGNRGQGGKSSYSNPANSGGGRGLAGVDALADFDFGPYISGVTQRIKRNFNPPSKDDSLKAVVIFTISRSGGVSGVRLLRSSGLAMFDEAALSAVKSSAPFRTFPPDADKSSIQMEFSFDYLGVRG